MNKKQPKSIARIVSGLLMIVALLWLSVSTPFVYHSEQLTKQVYQNDTESTDDPLSNTTEEKSESSASTLSEYLSELVHLEHPFATIAQVYKCHPSDLYFAFHPELFSPPPEA